MLIRAMFEVLVVWNTGSRISGFVERRGTPRSVPYLCNLHAPRDARLILNVR
jgi:hypothetical protein